MSNELRVHQAAPDKPHQVRMSLGDATAVDSLATN